MASKTRTGIGLAFAGLAGIVAAILALRGTLWPVEDADAAGLHGFGAVTLVPLLGLYLLTLSAYAFAFIIPQTRLALAQAIAMAIYGVVMLIAGISLLAAGIAAFVGLISLLLAFPFGTIAYFVQFGCGAGALEGMAEAANGVLEGHCFAGVQAMALLAVILKVLSLAILLLASPGFLKVRGLIVLVAIGAAIGLVVTGLFWLLSGLPFLMYPADAVVTALLGIVLAIYGVVVAIKSLLALALAIAGQAA